MATILDLGFLANFSFIFTFLLVFAIVFAILEKAQLLGKNRGLNAIIALVVGFLVLLSDNVRAVIEIAAPWFVLLMLFIMFILLAFNVFGADTGNFMSVLVNPEHKHIVYWIVALAIIIIMFSLSQVIGQDVGPFLDEEGHPVDNADWNRTLTAGERAGGGTSTATSDFNQNLGATIFHPKILGMILILLIASFAIRMLSQVSK
ncbi:hypothetical protein JW968_05095 [Candidatus Woesearchaeota archaeon]|nr:hypothetical protein [Candidatus Woesearchaeota archaeon]